jgi:uncharacterized repeat protein (TIGR01451 family)
MPAQVHQWVEVFTSGPGQARPESVKGDRFGNVFSAGDLSESVDFDPGPGVLMLYGGTAVASGSFIQKLSPDGDLAWAVAMPDLVMPRGIYLMPDSAGGVYVAGNFFGTVDFDPGPATLNVTAIGTRDGFLFKLSPTGSFEWLKLFGGGGGTLTPLFLETDSTGNLLMTGEYEGTIDFDPSIAVANHTATAPQADAFAMKFTASGDLVWEKVFSCTQLSSGQSIRADASGNVTLAGLFYASMDINPGPATSTVTTPPPGDIHTFLVNLDATGNYVWGKVFGAAYLSNHVSSPDGKQFLTGWFSDSVDVDAGAGVTKLYGPAGSVDASFLVAYDAAGNFLWGENVTSPTTTQGLQVELTNDGLLFNSGILSGTTDFAPGSGVFSLSPTGSTIYLQVFDTAGNFVSASLLDGTGNFPTTMTMAQGQDILLGGWFASCDFDPGPDSIYHFSGGASHGFILNLTADSCVLFSAVFDSLGHGNCTDTMGFASVIPVFGTPPFSYLWSTVPASTDTFITVSSTGIYGVTVSDGKDCSDERSVWLSVPETIPGFDYGITAILSGFVPGMTSSVHLDGWNTTCTGVPGQVRLVLPSLVTYLSAALPPTSVSGDTLIWDFPGLTMDSPHFLNTVMLLTDTTAVDGQAVCFSAFILPMAGDLNPMDNERVQICGTVTPSFDPNYKKVFPEGLCAPHYVPLDEPLQYTVHFQNTGSSEAINVLITDSLSAQLDLSTLQVLAASHSVWTEVYPGPKLGFHFDNILLPDSATDPEGSQGYVVFEISPLAGLPPGTEIGNTAEIIFDYNDPVITNTVVNTLTDTLPWFASFFADTVCSGADYLFPDGYMATGITTTMVHSIHLISPDGCDSLLTITVFPFSADTSVTVAGGVLNAAPGMDSYQWVNCSSGFAPVPGETGQTFPPATAGTYAVIVTQHGCIDTSSCHLLLVNVDPTEGRSPSVSLTPNPSEGAFTLLADSPIERFTIVNANGQIVHSENQSALPQTRWAAEVDFLPAGLYLVKVQMERGEATLRLVLR